MNATQNQDASKEAPRRGRPAIATRETVEHAVEELKGLNKRVTVRAVQKVVGGGAPKTISDLLKELPIPKSSIELVPTLPEALEKLWKTSVAEYTQSLLLDCQERVDASLEVIKARDNEIFDLQARVAELEALVDAIATERDMARGERERLQAELAESKELAGANRDRAEKAESEASLAKNVAEEMMQRAQTAEVSKEEIKQSNAQLQKQLSALSEKVARLEGQLEACLMLQPPAPGRAAAVPTQPSAPMNQATRSGPSTAGQDSIFDDDVPL